MSWYESILKRLTPMQERLKSIARSQGMEKYGTTDETQGRTMIIRINKKMGDDFELTLRAKTTGADRRSVYEFKFRDGQLYMAEGPFLLYTASMGEQGDGEEELYRAFKGAINKLMSDMPSLPPREFTPMPKRYGYRKGDPKSTRGGETRRKTMRFSNTYGPTGFRKGEIQMEVNWKDILKELSDYERAVAEEFATDEDMERPDYSKTGPFATLPEFPKVGRVKMPTVPKMGTKDSTTQDEDAKRRTEKNEAELLARLKARNQKSREEIGKQDPMMMEEMPPPPPPTGGPMPPPPPMDGMGMMPPPPMGMPPEQPEKPVVNPENASEFPVDPEQDDDMADKTGIRVKKEDWFSHVEKNVLSNFADRMMPSRVANREQQAFNQSVMDMDKRRASEKYGLTNQRFQEWANSNPDSYPDGSAIEGQVLPQSRIAMMNWKRRGGLRQVDSELYAKYPEPTRSA